MFRIVFVSMILLVLAQGAAMAETASVNSLTAEEKLVLGERMYREGILPNGEPIQAIVSADVRGWPHVHL